MHKNKAKSYSKKLQSFLGYSSIAKLGEDLGYEKAASALVVTGRNYLRPDRANKLLRKIKRRKEQIERQEEEMLQIVAEMRKPEKKKQETED